VNDFSPEQFEAELRRYKPAPPPSELVERLARAQPMKCVETSVRKTEVSRASPPWRELWLAARWWLAPAAAAVIGTALLIRAQLPHRAQPLKAQNLATTSAVKADDVQIQSDLVNSFDTVVRLPTGEPVRYRCREWVDEFTLRDRSRGLVVEQRTPRVEVVPVRFETY